MGKSALTKAPLATYLILALCMAGAVLCAANAYQGIAGRQSAGSDIRTAAQFACMKARQSDMSGCITCEDGNLACYEYLDTGEVFEDRVYWHGGWLMELYQESGAAIYNGWEDAGDKILPCDSARFDISGSTIRYELDVGGTAVHGSVLIRGGLRE